MRRRTMPARWWPGALLLAATALAAASAPTALLRGYLVAYMGALNLVLGALTVILVATLSGAHWVNWLAAPLRAAAATLPALALLTVPLWFHLDLIWPWALAAEAGPASPAQRWLQPPWPLVRSVSVWAAWLTVAAALGIWSLRRPLSLDTPRAAGALIVMLLSLSLFAVDWTMALVGHYKTSMAGFLLVSEQWVAALALGALWLCARGRFHAGAGKDVGNLLLAAVMFHGYCLYMDYLVTWEANLPHDIVGYLEREGWLLAASLPLILVLPLALLLFRDVKTRGFALGSVAVTVLAGHLLVVAWWLSPLFTAADGNPPWRIGDTAAAAMIASGWLWLFLAVTGRLDESGKAP